jgi:hypothetical protein
VRAESRLEDWKDSKADSTPASNLFTLQALASYPTSWSRIYSQASDLKELRSVPLGPRLSRDRLGRGYSLLAWEESLDLLAISHSSLISYACSPTGY